MLAIKYIRLNRDLWYMKQIGIQTRKELRTKYTYLKKRKIQIPKNKFNTKTRAETRRYLIFHQDDDKIMK